MDTHDTPPSSPSPSPSWTNRAAMTRRVWLWAGIAAAVGAALWAYSRFSEPSLVGTWSNRAPQNTVTFVFQEDGSGAMSIGAAQLPYQYRFDRTRDPAWLDLDARAEGRPVMIRAITKFSRADKLIIRLPYTGTPGERPADFLSDDVENTILLTRVEPGS